MQRTTRARRARTAPWAVLAALWAALGWAVLTAEPEEIGGFRWWLPAAVAPWSDLAGHCAHFAVQAWLLHRALDGPLGRRRALLVACALSVTYGAATEVAQRRIPGRRAEAADLLADAVGAVAYGGLAALRRGRQP